MALPPDVRAEVEGALGGKRCPRPHSLPSAGPFGGQPAAPSGIRGTGPAAAPGGGRAAAPGGRRRQVEGPVELFRAEPLEDVLTTVQEEVTENGGNASEAAAIPAELAYAYFFQGRLACETSYSQSKDNTKATNLLWGVLTRWGQFDDMRGGGRYNNGRATYNTLFVKRAVVRVRGHPCERWLELCPQLRPIL
eukprot:1178616-Prorocentrum_minimum.AAC.1